MPVLCSLIEFEVKNQSKCALAEQQMVANQSTESGIIWENNNAEKFAAMSVPFLPFRNQNNLVWPIKETVWHKITVSKSDVTLLT